MSFSVPSRLIEFEYLGGNGEVDEVYEEMARDYQHEIDLAFFITNFNYTKDDYYELTPKEKAFVMKAWESKLVSDTTHMRNSVLNAVGNSMRKKNSRFVDLWKKRQVKLDKDIAYEHLRIVQDIEENGDTSWVDKIYQANGMKRPQQEGGS